MAGLHSGSTGNPTDSEARVQGIAAGKTADLIQAHTLSDGGQSALDIARLIAAFVEPAQETLELALYDLDLHD